MFCSVDNDGEQDIGVKYDPEQCGFLQQQIAFTAVYCLYTEPLIDLLLCACVYSPE